MCSHSAHASCCQRSPSDLRQAKALAIVENANTGANRFFATLKEKHHLSAVSSRLRLKSFEKAKATGGIRGQAEQYMASASAFVLSAPCKLDGSFFHLRCTVLLHQADKNQANVYLHGLCLSANSSADPRRLCHRNPGSSCRDPPALVASHT